MKYYLQEYPPVLSVEDVAKILAITPRTVRKITKRGELHSVKVGRLIRIPKDDLVSFLERDE